MVGGAKGGWGGLRPEEKVTEQKTWSKMVRERTGQTDQKPEVTVKDSERCFPGEPREQKCAKMVRGKGGD